MNVDVLILVAATIADLPEAVRPNQGEPLGKHAGRRIEVAQPLDPLGGEAGLFLKLLDRRRFDRRAGVDVADEARREFDAAAIGAHPRLVDQDHFPLIFGEDHDRLDVARAAGIFPFAALQQAHELALAHRLGPREVVELHSSINLSGISFTSLADRGKCSASTAPTRSIAATIPSPGCPSRTWSSKSAIASPQVPSSVTLRIASSATISARRSAIDR